MSGCNLCPRRCKARPGGFCGAGDRPRVFRWGPHFGEEPPICGPRGSGAVFFSRCTMKCLYCQNSPWSWKGEGEDISTERLAGILRQLAVEDGCTNWNLVSPTPYLPFIRTAAERLRAEGVRLPFVWNSSGYESTRTLREYRDLCDIALIDLRYASDATALKAFYDLLSVSHFHFTATHTMIARAIRKLIHTGESTHIQLQLITFVSFRAINSSVSSAGNPTLLVLFTLLHLPPIKRGNLKQHLDVICNCR